MPLSATISNYSGRKFTKFNCNQAVWRLCKPDFVVQHVNRYSQPQFFHSSSASTINSKSNPVLQTENRSTPRPSPIKSQNHLPPNQTKKWVVCAEINSGDMFAYYALSVVAGVVDLNPAGGVFMNGCTLVPQNLHWFISCTWSVIIYRRDRSYTIEDATCWH